MRTSSLYSRSRCVKKNVTEWFYSLGQGVVSPIRNFSEVLFQTCRAWS